MSTQTQNATKTAADALGQFRELNERMLEASRKAGTAYLDTTEKTIKSLADLEVKLAKVSQIELFSAVADAHAELTREMTGVYVAAGRELLTQ